MSFPEIRLEHDLILNKTGKVPKFVWMNFPEIGLAHAPIIYKYCIQFWWMSFPEIGAAHAPEIDISKKILDDFSKVFLKSVCVTLRKTKISEKFLDDFSRIC